MTPRAGGSEGACLSRWPQCGQGIVLDFLGSLRFSSLGGAFCPSAKVSTAPLRSARRQTLLNGGKVRLSFLITLFWTLLPSASDHVFVADNGLLSYGRGKVARSEIWSGRPGTGQDADRQGSIDLVDLGRRIGQQLEGEEVHLGLNRPDRVEGKRLSELHGANDWPSIDVLVDKMDGRATGSSKELSVPSSCESLQCIHASRMGKNRRVGVDHLMSGVLKPPRIQQGIQKHEEPRGGALRSEQAFRAASSFRSIQVLSQVRSAFSPVRRKLRDAPSLEQNFLSWSEGWIAAPDGGQLGFVQVCPAGKFAMHLKPLLPLRCRGDGAANQNVRKVGSITETIDPMADQEATVKQIFSDQNHLVLLLVG